MLKEPGGQLIEEIYSMLPGDGYAVAQVDHLPVGIAETQENSWPDSGRWLLPDALCRGSA
jgi:hypothetical protein